MKGLSKDRYDETFAGEDAVIQVKMLTRGVVAVELRREKSFPRWRLAQNIGAKNPSPLALVGL